VREIIRKAPTSEVANKAKPWVVDKSFVDPATIREGWGRRGKRRSGTRSHCRVCGNLEMVMGFKKEGRERIYDIVPFESAPDAKSFLCGRCVAYGKLTEGKIESMNGRNSAEKLRAYVNAVEKKYPLHMLDYPELHSLKQELALIEDVTEENLKSWRKARNMTQRELGDLVGVSQQTVAKVEKGDRTIPARWVRIMDKIHPTHT
jgi:DNA-binding XRE family transcriptional regulator